MKTSHLRKSASDLLEPGLRSLRNRGSEVRSLHKAVRVSEHPRSQRLVKSASEHALFLQMMWTSAFGFASVFATGMLAIGVLWVWGASIMWRAFVMSIEQREVLLTVVGLGILMVSLIGIGASFVLAIRAYRIDVLGPKDIPLVLNRKTRKVYRFVQEVPGFGSYAGRGQLSKTLAFARDVFSPWPMVLVEYDWDCLEAEYFEKTTVMGNVVKTFHVLQFCVRESPSSDNVIGTFTIASPMMIGRDAAMDLWEFIRRYMEEGGPPLPPGDEPSPPHPRTLLQSAQTVAPKWWVLFLAGCTWSTWRYAQPDGFLILGVEAVVLFFVAFVCDLMMLVIFFNWLAHKLGQRVTLPEEVSADAGAPLDLGAVRG